MDINIQKIAIILSTLLSVCVADLYLLNQPAYNNLKFNGYTLENLVNIATLPTCAIRCGSNTACVSLFYNKESKSCILKSVLFLKIGKGILESGTKYYSVYQDGCPKDFIRNRKYDLCYQSFVDPVYQISTAKNRCTSNGYVLVRGKTVEAFNHISDQLLVSPSNGEGYFIGGSDSITEGKWRFDNGELMTAFIWGDGEPDSDSAGIDYIYLRKRNGKFEMSDTFPNLYCNYICQKL